MRELTAVSFHGCVQVYELTTKPSSLERCEVLKEWKKTGGLLVMSYQLFRLLANYVGRSKKLKNTYIENFLDPGNVSHCSTDYMKTIDNCLEK